jgi:hypothetical protein
MGVIKKLIVAFLILFFLSALTKNFFEYRKNLEFYNSFKNDYDTEYKKNISLRTQIIKNNDPNQIEKTIRDKLNLVKEKELVVIIPPPTPTPVIIIPTPMPVYEQWVHTFFKN